MVTRKDIARYRVWRHRGHMGMEELILSTEIWLSHKRLSKIRNLHKELSLNFKDIITLVDMSGKVEFSNSNKTD